MSLKSTFRSFVDKHIVASGHDHGTMEDIQDAIERNEVNTVEYLILEYPLIATPSQMRWLKNRSPTAFMRVEVRQTLTRLEGMDPIAAEVARQRIGPEASWSGATIPMIHGIVDSMRNEGLRARAG
jgi:hypothetical protein